MAESKFAGIFNQPAIAEESASPNQAETPVVVAKSVGRPQGKRSDPEYKQYSALLKKQTHRQASNILRDQEGAGKVKDISELLQSLLEQWVKKQQKT